MARLPPFKRFSLEDFPGQKDWIDKLLSPLNEFTTRISGALDGQLSLSENLLTQVNSFSVTTSATLTDGTTFGLLKLPPYATLVNPVKLKLRLRVKPIGLEIWKVVEDATNATTLHYGVTADWSYADGIVTIASLSGLYPARSYNVTVAMYGG